MKYRLFCLFVGPIVALGLSSDTFARGGRSGGPGAGSSGNSSRSSRNSNRRNNKAKQQQKRDRADDRAQRIAEARIEYARRERQDLWNAEVDEQTRLQMSRLFDQVAD